MSKKEELAEVRAALKDAGRGGWRVDLEAISDVAAKCIEEQKNKFSVEKKDGSIEITENDS